MNDFIMLYDYSSFFIIVLLILKIYNYYNNEKESKIQRQCLLQYCDYLNRIIEIQEKQNFDLAIMLKNNNSEN